MARYSWKWLFTFEGRVQRLEYFLAGIGLLAIKYAIDWSVAARFGEHWYLIYAQHLKS
jgi:uncharacterized membrane protein YhaH (DUF805 family)